MIYDPATRALYHGNGTLVAVLDCPRAMAAPDAGTMDFDGQTLCEGCGKSILDLTPLTDNEAAVALATRALELCVRLQPGASGCVTLRSDRIGPMVAATSARQAWHQSDDQREDLVIETARTWQAINEGAKRGFWPLVMPIQDPSTSPLERRIKIVQHAITGEIEVFTDPRQRSPDDCWRTVLDWTRNLSTGSTLPVAAYLVPKELKIGSRVRLADPIPDRLSESHGRAMNVPAIWNGRDFEVEWPEPSRSFVL